MRKLRKISPVKDGAIAPQAQIAGKPVDPAEPAAPNRHFRFDHDRATAAK